MAAPVMKEKQAKRRNPVNASRLECLTTMGMGVAHDFNNLLAAILGNALVIARSLPAGFAGAESVRQIEGCATRGVELTRRILFFTGRAPFAPTRINLSTMIRDMAESLKTFQQEAVTVDFRLNEQMPEIAGDPVQVRQLVLELVSNSAESLIERTGVITIETGIVQCDREYLQSVSLNKELAEGPYAYVQVSDNGIGIPMRSQKHMFEPFFTTKLRGQGLGLCVVAGVLRAHHGGIECWSRVRQGSRFKALFPVA
jgi:two-component system, cell cycle sensor histidine kinase and response regulator CckA